MTTTPIAELFERLGREDNERVTFGYFNATHAWTHANVPLAAADTWAKAMSEGQGMNVYTMINSAAALTGNHRGEESDITRLNAIWADIDFKDNGMGNEARSLELVELLSDAVGSPPAALVYSGHGVQPYWAIDPEDGQLDESNRPFVATLVKRWGILVKLMAENLGGKVDGVFDLPRVFRAPGTINYKEVENPVPVLTTFPEDYTPLSLKQIEEVLDSYNVQTDTITGESVEQEDWPVVEEDCQYIPQLMGEITNGTVNGRHPRILAMSTKIWAAVRMGCMTQKTAREAMELLEARFEAELRRGTDPREQTPGEFASMFNWSKRLIAAKPQSELSREVNSHTHQFGLHAVPSLPLSSMDTSDSSELSDGNLALAPVTQLRPIVFSQESFTYTDSGNGERLARDARGKYIQVPGLGWMIFKDGRYTEDVENSIVVAAQKSMMDFASSEPSNDRFKFIQKSLSHGGVRASVALAAVSPELMVDSMNLDNKPFELCTPSGIVDLLDASLRAADPVMDLHTQQTTVSPTHMPTPKWDAFLKMVLIEDDMVNYMQQLFGIALIGEVRWHVLPMLEGVGQNGKSTLLEITSRLLGGYAKAMPENFLLETRGDAHPTELADLRGVRLAIASETRPDGKFNEGRVKQLTGGDTLRARRMRQDFFQFTPSHTLFIALNHKPMVRAGGLGFWRRLRSIQFKYVVPEHLRNEQLVTQLIAEEGSGILQWMIDGSAMVLRDGLKEPSAVKMATEQYKTEEDVLGNFIAECLLENPEDSVPQRRLHDVYSNWCNSSGYDALGLQQFLRELAQRMSTRKVRVEQIAHIQGVSILTDAAKTTEVALGRGNIGLWSGDMSGMSGGVS